MKSSYIGVLKIMRLLQKYPNWLVVADGQTYIEAVQKDEIAIDEWIEIARLMERDIPVARGKLVYV